MWNPAGMVVLDAAATVPVHAPLFGIVPVLLIPAEPLLKVFPEITSPTPAVPDTAGTDTCDSPSYPVSGFIVCAVVLRAAFFACSLGLVLIFPIFAAIVANESDFDVGTPLPVTAFATNSFPLLADVKQSSICF